MPKRGPALFSLLMMNWMTAIGQTVIQDTGRTVPSSQYFSHLLHSIDSSEESPLIQFPIATNELHPGELKQSATLPNAHWLTQPIFVIGTDELSKAWLKSNGETLVRLNATGLIISVPDASTFKALRRQTDVTITPSRAPGLLNDLKKSAVHVYPVLILTDGKVVQDLSPWKTASSEAAK